MCHTNNDKLMDFKPASDFTITPHGYDEEEEWEGNTSNLESWLLKNKATITSISFNVGDIIKIKKKGTGKVLERFDIFKRGKNWFPIYSVELESGKIQDINQNEIIPNAQNDSETHLRHCYQGEYEDSCKYGEDDCPAKSK